MSKQSETATKVVSNEISQLANSIYQAHNYKSLSGQEKWMPAGVAFDLAKKILSHTNNQLSTR